jgi:hypothetical protein
MNHGSRASLRHVVSVAAFATGLLVPVIANAQQPNANCPPGSWFCADTGTQPAAPPNQPVPPSGQQAPLEPLPAPEHPTPPPAPPQEHRPLPPPPPVVVYQPPPPVMVVRPEAPPPPPYYYAPRERIRREWGLRFQLEGLSIGRGNGNGREASMGGLGFGLRYKPVPAFGIETDLDFVGGTDYNGNERKETAFTINGLIFLNPRSKAQLYLLGGFGWSGAKVNDQTSGQQMNYAYFGAQAGFGLELRLSRHFALNGDVRGFVRGRIDDQAQYYPEFRNAQGQTTNTSGGGLLTLGATIYF